jgi:hypothetical protein
MTCHDARDRLSARLDDALDAAERHTLDAHLAGCADCRRELEQLRATTALLGRLPSVRAPAGFVDRVMAEAYRPPWPRRLLDALFVPLRVKLPLEAAAVLLVGVSALYVHQRTPEVRELARQEAPAPSPVPPAVPPAPSSETVTTPSGAAPPLAGATDRARDGERAQNKQRAASEAKRKPAKDAAPREEAQPPGPAAVERPPAGAQAAPGPAARPDDVRSALTAKKEAELEQRSDARSKTDALGKTASPAGSERAPEPAEASAARDATTAAAGARAAPSAASPPASAPEAQGRVGGAASAPAAPSSSGAAAETPPPAKSRMAARLTRAVDASGRLTVPARVPAEQALDALLARLGAARVGRLLEGDRGMIVIDVLVPGPRYRELIEGLGQIGRWVTEYESGTLPAQVRVEVALTVEP